MPDSCAKAFAPTMALFACTVIPVTLLTRRDAAIISSVTIFVRASKYASLVLSAITTSSMDALPARSPMPLMVHSTCPAPESTAARELDTGKPQVVVAMH